MRLSGWLKIQPQPAKVRVHTADGVKEVVIAKERHRPWFEAEQAILALEATKVEALTSDGMVIRAQNITVEDEPGAEPADPAAPRAGESDLQSFARLLAGAYKDANSAQAQSYDRLLDLVKLMFERTNALEKARPVDGAGKPGELDEIMKMVGPIIAQKLAGGMGGAPPPNGGAK